MRVTALQGRAAGGPKNPYYIRRDGYIVAFTVTLADAHRRAGRLLQRQLRLARAGAASSVLRRGDTRKTRLNYRLVSQTELYRRGQATSAPARLRARPAAARSRRRTGSRSPCPTWAPIFANNLTRSDWWRSSRAQEQLRGAAQPAPVRDDGAARGERVRLHVQRRAAALHGHLRAGPEADRDAGRVGAIAFPGLLTALASTRDHRGVDLHGRLPRLRRRLADRVADLVLPAARRRRRLHGDDGGGRRGPRPPNPGKDGPGGDGIRLPLGRSRPAAGATAPTAVPRAPAAGAGPSHRCAARCPHGCRRPRSPVPTHRT